MLRSLPPVGHPIRLRVIADTFLGMSKRDASLEASAPGSSFFWMSSGTAALTLASLVLKSKVKKGEVIIPAYTCPSLPASVIKAGLKPVLCDIDKDSFRMNLNSLTAKIGADTVAIIAVHLLGIPERIVEIRKIARRNNIVLIEDAAQAFGNSIQEEGKTSKTSKCELENYQYLGTFGDIGIFSFRRGKPLGLLGGGAILSNNQSSKESIQALYDSLPESYSPSTLSYLINLLLFSIFYHPKLYWLPQSIPWLRLGETIFTLKYEVKRINPKVIQMGEYLIPKFEKIRRIRHELAIVYKNKLEPMRPEFDFITESCDERIALLRFPLILKSKEKRDRILAVLKKSGLGATASFPVPLNEQAGLMEYFTREESYPNAKYVSERILTLPLHEYVRGDDIETMIMIIKKELSRRH